MCTARSRISGEKPFDFLFMALSSKSLEPPQNPGRFKYYFGLDSFVMRDFWVAEAAMSVAMLAYNLMSVFRQAAIKQK